MSLLMDVYANKARHMISLQRTLPQRVNIIDPWKGWTYRKGAHIQCYCFKVRMLKWPGNDM